MRWVRLSLGNEIINTNTKATQNKINWTLPSTEKVYHKSVYSPKPVKWLGLVSNFFSSPEAVIQMYFYKKGFWKYALELQEKIHEKVWLK